MINILLGAMQPSTIVMLVLLAVMVVVLIVLPMFTNSRRNKAINDLHSSLRAGDVIKTVGGIVGTILEIKEVGPLDKEMVIETGVGDKKCTMVFDIQAVYQVVSKTNAPAEKETPANEQEAQEAATPVAEAKAETPVAEETTAEQAAEPVAAEAEEAPATDAKAEEKPAAPKSKTAKK